MKNDLMDPSRDRNKFTLTVQLRGRQRLARHLNLQLTTSPDWSIPGGPGTTSIEESAKVRTEVSRARPWTEHIDLHHAVRELLELSAWRELPFTEAKVLHEKDPERVISGDRIGNRWSPVISASLPTGRVRNAPLYLFHFDDIGPAGVKRWLSHRQRFARGLATMTFHLRNRGASLEGLVTDCGVGLESIGHQIGRERGRQRRRGHPDYLAEIAAEVEDLLPFDADHWVQRSTACYNDVKHPDRENSPSADELHEALIDNWLVFRVWMARRLGVKDGVIEQSMWRLRRS